MLTTTDVGNVTQGQGQGVSDHQLLPISGAQHVQAIFHWYFFPSLQCANCNEA